MTSRAGAAAAFAIAVPAGLAVVEFGEWSIAAAGTVVLVSAVAVLRRRLQPTAVSPVQYVALGFVAVAVLGALFSGSLAHSGGSAVIIDLTPSVKVRTFWMFLIATGAFATGVAVYVAATGRVKRVDAGLARRSIAGRLTPRTRRRLIVGSTMPLLLTLIDVPVSSLLSRADYLPPRGITSGLGANLAVAAVLVLAYVTASGRHARTLAVGLLVTYSGLFFALGSRKLALVPVLVLIGVSPFVAKGRHLAAGAAIAGVAAPWLGQLPFYLRGLDDHGLIPYASSLPEYITGTGGLGAVVNGGLVSFPLSGAAAFMEPSIPAADYLVEVNPLPGRLTSWYQIGDRHRFNPVAPYSALGELGNRGWWAVIAYFGVVGVVFGHLDRRVGHYLRRGSPLVGFAILGVCGLFVLYAIQYDLRSATRLVYYAIAIDILGRARRSRRVLNPGVAHHDDRLAGRRS